MTAPRRDAYDLVVVGAGPAGMAAAAEAATGRVSVLVVDDNLAAGGQVWRSAGAGALADGRVLGKDYAAGGATADPAYGTETLRDVGLLILSGWLVIWDRTKLSVDRLVFG